MNKGYYLRGLCLLAVLSCLSLGSCTYDYFEDETNYVVYVPKADKNLRTETYGIEDLNIFIYDSENLIKERCSHYPFAENARSMSGNFNFRLYPGSYYAFCLTGMNNVTIENQHQYSNAGLYLQKNTDGTYQEPSEIYVERTTPTIQFPGPTLTDTACLEEKYIGCICIAFKNLTIQNPLLTYNNIKEVEIEASGIGVMQYLFALTDQEHTRSSRNSADDKMRLASGLFDPGYKDFEFGIQNNYFPSPDLSQEAVGNEPIHLKLRFKNAEGNVLSQLEVPVIDQQGDPIVLHMGETLIVEVDGNNIQILRLDDPEQWNPQIEEEGGSSSGGGGLEI